MALAAPHLAPRTQNLVPKAPNLAVKATNLDPKAPNFDLGADWDPKSISPKGRLHLHLAGRAHYLDSRVPISLPRPPT